MSDAKWIELAQGTADEINDHAWSQEFMAERSYGDWQITLQELGVLRCDVVPFNGPDVSLDDRGDILLKCPVFIMFRYRVKQEERDANTGRARTEVLDPYSLLLQEVLLHFCKLALDDTNGICETPEIVQTHGSSPLIEHGQWAGVLKVVYEAQVGLS